MACKWLVSSHDQDRSRLASCPVEALRLAPAATLLLKRLGLKRIGQLYDVPRISLERRFATAYAAKKGVRAGSKNAEAHLAGAVLTRLDQALGLAPEPLRPLGTPPLLSERQTWSEPLISAEALEGNWRASPKGSAQPSKPKTSARAASVSSLYRADGSVIDVEAGLEFCQRRCASSDAAAS